MKTDFQRKIDRVLGRQLALLLNVLVRILGKLLRIDHSLDKDFERIVVCKYKGMGSIIQSTPLLQTLRKRYPNAHITYVSTASNKGIIQKLDMIDEALYLSDKNMFSLLSSIWSLLWKMWRQRPELYIDLEVYSNFSSLITTMSMAKNRVGFYLRSTHYRLGTYTHMMFFNNSLPISSIYLQAARLLNCDDFITDLYPLESELKDYTKSMSAIGLSDQKAFITINPNASDLRLERRWPASHFQALIEKLRLNFPDYQLVLLGAPSEASYVASLYEPYASDEMILNAAGKTNMEELIFVIGKADLMITNDTGPMHMAFATETTTVSLYGPSNSDHYGHYKNNYVVQKALYCSPCIHEFEQSPCKGDNQCMQLISVSDVMEQVMQAMEDMKNGGQISKKSNIIYDTGNGVLGLVTR